MPESLDIRLTGSSSLSEINSSPRFQQNFVVRLLLHFTGCGRDSPIVSSPPSIKAISREVFLACLLALFDLDLLRLTELLLLKILVWPVTTRPFRSTWTTSGRLGSVRMQMWQVWSPTQFYSVGFLQSRIMVHFCKHTINVCVSWFYWDLHALRDTPDMCPSISEVPEATQKGSWPLKTIVSAQKSLSRQGSRWEGRTKKGSLIYTSGKYVINFSHGPPLIFDSLQLPSWTLLTLAYFSPIFRHPMNRNFRNLEFREKILEFSEKILEFSPKS